MKIFEHLLLFLCATQQQIWTLHLTSLLRLSKHFFPYDMLHYARFTLVYLAQMFALKEKDEEAWNVLNNCNFSVNKSSIPYTALGADHALEQANKTMKIHGGIKGIANNQVTLDQYFVIAPENASIIEKFYTFFGITDTEDQEHQLKVGKNKRIADNVEKLTIVFEESDCVYNTVTKKILPEKFENLFLNHEQEGEKRLKDFISDSIEGNISIWKPLKKAKLPTLNVVVKSFKTNIDGKTIRFKEKRKFMSRLMAAGRSRPEIDIIK